MKQRFDFLKMKKENEPIVMVTAYDYPSARNVEQAEVDMILVGDSLGMVVLGYESTIYVTVDDMIHHAKAVRKGASDTFVVTDMPFMSYHTSTEDALNTARRMMQESGTNAVKVEGSGNVLNIIEELSEAGVPVVSHLGLTPQSVGVLGGYRVQGKEPEAAQKLINDALHAEASGAIAIVLECVPQQLAEVITNKLTIPTIGIGAGKYTNGQVLVYHDILSYGVERVPKFVKQYTNIDKTILTGLKQFASDVKSQRFPEELHSFSMSEEAVNGLYGGDNK